MVVPLSSLLHVICRKRVPHEEWKYPDCGKNQGYDVIIEVIVLVQRVVLKTQSVRPLGLWFVETSGLSSGNETPEKMPALRFSRAGRTFDCRVYKLQFSDRDFRFPFAISLQYGQWDHLRVSLLSSTVLFHGTLL